MGIKKFIRKRLQEREIRRRIEALIRERPGKLWLEVGAGEKQGENGWITLDLNDGCDLRWDLRRGIPFPEDGIEKIYSSHFLEHLSFDEAQTFFKECLRAMVPGGAFIVCVPNARIYIDGYMNAAQFDSDFYMRYRPAFKDGGRMDIINYIAYMDGHHKYMFDEDNLLRVLEKGGFRNARLRPFDPTLDLRDRDYESLYAIAEK